MTSRMRPAVVLLALLALAPASTRAQDVPVVFVHGLLSDAGAWNEAAPRLASELRITPHRTDTAWQWWLESQADQLQARFGNLPANTIAIGHSNGGLVARQWSKSRHLKGIVTMGTPHEGALMAARALNYVGANNELMGYLNFVVAMVGGPENEFSWMWPFMAGHLNFVSWLANATAAEILWTLGFANGAPVLGQMVPNSAFLTQLNSSTNLSRERSAVGTRVGMVFAAREYWRAGAAVGLAPQIQDSVATSVQTAIVILDAAAAYVRNYPWNPRAQILLQNIQTLSQILRSLDPGWCWVVTNDASCATSHDGIVATPAQYYPGGTNIGFYGPPHRWQTRESAPMLRNVLIDHFGVEVRATSTPTPPPGPSPTPPPPPPPPPPGTEPWVLLPGQSLTRDQDRVSRNGAFRLVYQGDGNLVLYRVGGSAIWHSVTHGTSPGQVAMQGDGNLVIYNAAGQAVWNSATQWAPGSRAELNDAGYLVIFDEAGTPIWWAGGQ